VKEAGTRHQDLCPLVWVFCNRWSLCFLVPQNYHFILQYPYLFLDAKTVSNQRAIFSFMQASSIMEDDINSSINSVVAKIVAFFCFVLACSPEQFHLAFRPLLFHHIAVVRCFPILFGVIYHLFLYSA
jgi:hypothetical protein